jgi:enolase-phosphatase E1
VSLGDEGQIRVILLDIEGTTTPVDFVYKTLFPYAACKLESFLREHARDPEIGVLLEDLRAQNELDEAQGLRPPVWLGDAEEARLRSGVAYAQWLIAKDSKCTALKSLEGRIWQEGYERGELHGEVFPDVPRAFARWRRQGREICIYSSGSVLAQQLLFRTVTSGNLTAQIAGFFDTHVGSKSDAESYKKIAAAVGRSPREFLFLSDSANEVEAAWRGEMRGTLCVRDPRATAPLASDAVIRSFDEVFSD